MDKRSYDHQYYVKNRDKLNAKARQYYAEHHDEISARRRQRYAEQRDGINTKRRQAYQESPGEQQRRSRQYRRQHGAECKEADHGYYVKNRERIKTANKQRYWREKTKDPRAHAKAARAKYLQRQYGLSLDQYARLLRKQKALCVLCQQPMKHGGRITNEHAVVDHDHKTGKIRGILHARCNTLLASFDDDPRLLARIAKYLKRRTIRL